MGHRALRRLSSEGSRGAASSAHYFFAPWLLAIASISRCICSYWRFISGSLIVGRSANPDMRRIMRFMVFMRCAMSRSASGLSGPASISRSICSISFAMDSISLGMS